MQSLKTFRAEKDQFFGRHHQRPVTPAENRLKVAVRAEEKFLIAKQQGEWK
jgi:uncharacterized protein (DUF1684 family)